MSNPLESVVTTVPLSTLSVNENLHQVRCEIDPEVVERYRQAMQEDVKFPPLRVIEINGTRHLAEGFHRFYAYQALGVTAAPCLVSKGTEWDILTEAIKGNSVHGQPLTNHDRQRAATMLFEMMAAGGKKMTDQEISNLLGGVSRVTITRWRNAWAEASDPQEHPAADEDDDLPDFDDESPDPGAPVTRQPAAPKSDERVVQIVHGIEAGAMICKNELELLSSVRRNFDAMLGMPQCEAFKDVAMEVKSKIEWLTKTFEARAPEHVCPACNAAADLKCPRCRQRGFLTRDEMAVWDKDQQAKKPQ